jgi:hypothetical protein
MADTTRYVNTASTAGGDGTTNATTGANRAFANLFDAEAALPADITTGGSQGIWTIICTGSLADTTPVTFAGTTTSATYYIVLKASDSDKASASWDAGKYRLSTVDTALSIGATYYIVIRNLQIEVTSVSASSKYGIYTTATSTEIASCHVRHVNSATYSKTAIVTISTTSYIYDCVAVSTGNSNDTGILVSGGTASVYSCSIVGSGYGVRRTSGTAIAKNCYAKGYASGGYDYSGTITKTNCASSDTTADGTSPKTGIVYSTTADSTHAGFTNVTAGSEDLHLKVGSALIGAGADTSGETAPLNFTTDIDGQTRSGTWDIGADEYVAAGGISIPVLLEALGDY